jgi:hypothetical protein
VIRNKYSVLRGRDVSLPTNPQAGGPPTVGCPRLLIQYIRSYPPYLEAVSSIRNPRTRHISKLYLFLLMRQRSVLRLFIVLFFFHVTSHYPAAYVRSDTTMSYVTGYSSARAETLRVFDPTLPEPDLTLPSDMLSVPDLSPLSFYSSPNKAWSIYNVL